MLRFILESLAFHRRIHVAVALGVMAATAVLTGALHAGLQDVAVRNVRRKTPKGVSATAAASGTARGRGGAPERYRASFYDGPHKFDREMQKEAFVWFDRWLNS